MALRWARRSSSQRLVTAAVACVLCVGLALAPSAWSAPPPRVALVSDRVDSTTTKRLKAELEQLGVRCEVIQAGPGTPIGRASLENVARRAGAFAAIRVVPIAAEVEVWVADRVTGKTVVREVIRGSSSSSSVDDTIALGAVELLRASLLEVNATTKLQHGEIPPPPVVEEIAPPPPRRAKTKDGVPWVAGVALEPALDIGFDGITPGVAAQVLIRFPWGKQLNVEALGLLSVVPGKIEDNAESDDASIKASAEVSTQALGLGLTWSWHSAGVSPLLGLGLLGAALDVEGDPPGDSDHFRHQNERLRLGAPYARLGAGFALLESLRARVDAELLYSLRDVPIRFVDDEVASWGQPSLLLGAGLEILLPE
jgi:hypothetical protein